MSTDVVNPATATEGTEMATATAPKKPKSKKPATKAAPKAAKPAVKPPTKTGTKSTGTLFGGLDSVQIRRSSEMLKVSGQDTRAKVLGILSEGTANVTEICGRIGQSQPAVSHHLSLLRAARFVEVARDGKNNNYTLTESGELLWKALMAISG